MRIFGELKFQCDYVCTYCRAVSKGTCQMTQIDAYSVERALHQIESEIKPDGLSFPVGWTHSFGDVYNCQNCTKGTDT